MYPLTIEKHFSYAHDILYRFTIDPALIFYYRLRCLCKTFPYGDEMFERLKSVFILSDAERPGGSAQDSSRRIQVATAVILLEVANADEALKWAQANPANGWGSIEIRPVARTYAADRGWHTPVSYTHLTLPTTPYV